MTFLKKVEVRCYRGRGTGSGFIKWFTFALSGITHVSLVFYFSDGSVIEIEALQWNGVIEHDPNSPEENDFITLVAPLTEQQAWEAYEIAHSLVGAKYDWLGIWGFLRRKKRHSADKWFCSELVAYVLFKAGCALSRRQPFQETPAMVRDTMVLKAP